MAHPANVGLRKVLEKFPQGMRGPAFALPGTLKDPYYALGAHPDLVARLWDELGKTLPEDCRAVFCGNPALLHPGTGVVFGFAMGTHTYALRLPEAERRKALAAGASRVKEYPVELSFDLGQVGEEWVF